MNVEIGTEAAQFPEKEYINVIFFAVCALGRHYDRPTVDKSVLIEVLGFSRTPF